MILKKYHSILLPLLLFLISSTSFISQVQAQAQVVIIIEDVIDPLLIGPGTSTGQPIDRIREAEPILIEAGKARIYAKNSVTKTQIIDFNGRVIWADQQSYQSASLDLRKLPVGNYVLAVDTGSGSVAKKFGISQP
ncbi:MAG: T9SS type A sorting domain-containing protein [Bacteroidota bacterium]